MWPWLLIGFTLGAMWVTLVAVLVAAWAYERGRTDQHQHDFRLVDLTQVPMDFTGPWTMYLDERCSCGVTRKALHSGVQV